MKRRFSLVQLLFSALLIISSVHLTLGVQNQNTVPAQDEGQWIPVEGEVRAPQRVAYFPEHRPYLTQMLAMAGGFKRGAKRLIQITHNDGSSTMVRFRGWRSEPGSKSNPYLRAGDVITVK